MSTIPVQASPTGTAPEKLIMGGNIDARCMAAAILTVLFFNAMI